MSDDDPKLMEYARTLFGQTVTQVIDKSGRCAICQRTITHIPLLGRRLFYRQAKNAATVIVRGKCDLHASFE